MQVPGATVAERLGRYEIQSHLATGGMAEIYRATAPDGTGAVIKVISRERATDQKFIQMFLDEARVVATLNHPNIARLLEVGKDGQVYYLAMEYVRGETVRAILARSAKTRARVPWPVALGIVSRVAQALHHAHDRKGLSGAPLNIVHRDITPSNVMVSYDGVVKLLDFGIARAAGRSQETMTGTVKGKFAYMAPEQCKGRRVDRRADVFSLGILMYELTTLKRAFRGETDFETLTKIINLDILPPSKIVRGYPPAAEAVLFKAMGRTPEERYQTAAELAAALEELGGELGGLADRSALAGFMAERFVIPSDGDGEEAEIVVEGHAPEPEPTARRPATPSSAPLGPSAFAPALVPRPDPTTQPSMFQASSPAPPSPPPVDAAPPAAPSPPPAAAPPPSAPPQPQVFAVGAPSPSEPSGQGKTMMGVLAPTRGSGTQPVQPRPSATPVSMPVARPTPSAMPVARPTPSAMPVARPTPSAMPVATPTPTSTPTPGSVVVESVAPDGAELVELPAPPPPYKGSPWALVVALVAIVLVGGGVAAILMFT